MNIIIDEATKDGLMGHVIDSITFGSHMKNTSNKDSDTDVLVIIEESMSWFRTPVATQHLLQFKGHNTDLIFCTPSNFVKSLVDGDSTIFHEILKNGALTGTCLEFLNNINFDHYKTIRAYLGIARRDIKEVTKYWARDNKKALKKLQFVVDGLRFVLTNNNGSVSDIEFTQPTTIQEAQEVALMLSKIIDSERSLLNANLENGSVEYTTSADDIVWCTTVLNKFVPANYAYGLDYFIEQHAART